MPKRILNASWKNMDFIEFLNAQQPCFYILIMRDVNGGAIVLCEVMNGNIMTSLHLLPFN